MTQTWRCPCLTASESWHRYTVYDLIWGALPWHSYVSATWYTDRSSFVQGGQRPSSHHLGESSVGWTEAYCHLCSKCRRTKDLELGQGWKVNIYTDSCYAFATTHVHGTMYKERGSLFAKRKTIKNIMNSVHSQNPIKTQESGHHPFSRVSEGTWAYFQV